MRAKAASSWLGGSWKTLLLALMSLVLAATTLMVSQDFEDKLHPAQLVGGWHIRTKTGRLQASWDLVEDPSHVIPHSSGLVTVRDIVEFPDEVMLLVKTVDRSNLPRKDAIQCLFGKQYKSGIFTVEWKDDEKTVVAVRCEHPSGPLSESKEATLIFTDSKVILHSTAQYLSNSSYQQLVYETVTLSDDVLLFAKGLVNSQGKPNNHSKDLDLLSCRFGWPGAEVITKVRLIAQEVVRCELPPPDLIPQLKGSPVSLFVPKVGVFRTVAYFDTPKAAMNPQPAQRRFHICACTMLWNEAAFLKEWIIYHGFLGIEKWYLYDNNSDDDIEEVLKSLEGKYNISRIPWPWIKTQEAGSPTALCARGRIGEWVLFADVDEFVYPAKELHDVVARSSSTQGERKSASAPAKTPPSLDDLRGILEAQKTTILRRLIDSTLHLGLQTGKRVGEVRLVCHNFGPSRLKRAPKDGVTVAYTCRMRWPRRHKSFVLLDAVNDNLLNMVHHFQLRDEYREMAVHARQAVINHYKYQAWDVFKAKFVRRVATYVVDWRHQEANSSDRAPDMGLDAVEPQDWPSRYCEEEDTGLRNFTASFFRDPQANRMLWQGDEIQ